MIFPIEKLETIESLLDSEDYSWKKFLEKKFEQTRTAISV